MTAEELDLIRSKLARNGGTWGPRDVVAALQESGMVVSDALVLHVIDQLRQTSQGAGRLEPLLQDPAVTDVLVNGPDQVMVDRGAGLHRAQIQFSDDEEVRRLATRLATLAGRRLDDACPYVDARLPNGVRLHAILAPLAAPGTCISLRVPAKSGMSLQDWLANGSINNELFVMLRKIIKAKASFLITGGTGTGKTTLLSSMLSEVPSQERLLVVEDSRELTPRHPHCVRLEARNANAEGSGRVSLTDLVRQALRMRPDRVILGEVRGPEICDLLTALNTGHEGGCGTIHANSVADVPARIEALTALGGMDQQATQAQAGAALDLVIHLKREAGKRRVAEIGVFTNQDQQLQVIPALTWSGLGDFAPGPGYDRLLEVISR